MGHSVSPYGQSVFYGDDDGLVYTSVSGFEPWFAEATRTDAAEFSATVPGAAGLSTPALGKVAVDPEDVVSFGLWLRCEEPLPEATLCGNQVVFEEREPPYQNRGLEKLLETDAEWTLHRDAFIVNADTALDTVTLQPGQAGFSLRLGYLGQVVDVGPSWVENWGNNITSAQLKRLYQTEHVDVIGQDYDYYPSGVVQMETVAVADDSGDDILPFSSFKRFRVGEFTGANNEAGYITRTIVPLRAGDLLQVEFWARCIPPPGTNTPCPGELQFEKALESEGFAKLSGPVELLIEPLWARYFVPIEVLEDRGIEEAQFAFRLGYAHQTVEFGDMRVVNYRNALSMTELLITQAPAVQVRPLQPE